MRKKPHNHTSGSLLMRYKPYAAVYLVLLNDQKILLLKRHNTGFGDGNYSMIAGHIDEGETATQAICREALEEAGIRVLPSNLQLVHLQHHKSQDREYIDFYFKTDYYSGEIQNMEPHKCADLDWFLVDALPDNTIPYIKNVIEHITNNIFYSEFGWDTIASV